LQEYSSGVEKASEKASVVTEAREQRFWWESEYYMETWLLWEVRQAIQTDFLTVPMKIIQYTSSQVIVCGSILAGSFIHYEVKKKNKKQSFCYLGSI
jgi:hypothetical protein